MQTRIRDRLLAAVEAADHYAAVAIVRWRALSRHVGAARRERIAREGVERIEKRKKAERERIHYTALGIHIRSLTPKRF